MLRMMSEKSRTRKMMRVMKTTDVTEEDLGTTEGEGVNLLDRLLALVG